MTRAPILCLPDSKAGFRVKAIRKLNPQLLSIGAFRSLSQAKEAEAFAAEADIILRNGAKLSCEETIPSTGKSHSTVRHGVAGRCLQYVPGFFFESAGYARPNEQFSKRKERWAACCAAFDDSAPGKLAACF